MTLKGGSKLEIFPPAHHRRFLDHVYNLIMIICNFVQLRVKFIYKAVSFSYFYRDKIMQWSPKRFIKQNDGHGGNFACLYQC